jgi:hypothetical protein
MSNKLEMVKCHHAGCGHEWEPRVKNPKRCPQCQNPLWKSARPKKLKAEQTSTIASVGVLPTPPTTDTTTADDPLAVPGVEAYKAGNDMFVGRTALSIEPVETLEPIYQRVEVEPESAVQRLQREAEERLRRLADQPID